MNRSAATGGPIRAGASSTTCCPQYPACLATSVAVYAVTPAPGTCPNDSKLLNDGPTQIAGDGPGTWWGLVVNDLLIAGFVDEGDQIDYLNDIFGTSFGTLDELRAHNLQLVADTWDENRNGYVCAFLATRHPRALRQSVCRPHVLRRQRRPGCEEIGIRLPSAESLCTGIRRTPQCSAET